jgi:hypothetical protein
LILNPVLDADQLMKAIAMELNLQVKGLDRLETVAEINRFLLQQVEHGKDTVLIIDEAQDLTPSCSNRCACSPIWKPTNANLLQIVLMGQPELRDRLNDYGLRQLRQRITIRYHLNPLKAQRNRPVRAASLAGFRRQRRALFHPAALWRIYNYSKGIPRLINAICDKCLLAGYVAQRDKLISAWSAGPGGNWKGRSIYEPDQRRPQTRQPVGPNRPRPPETQAAHATGREPAARLFRWRWAPAWCWRWLWRGGFSGNGGREPPHAHRQGGKPSRLWPSRQTRAAPPPPEWQPRVHEIAGPAPPAPVIQPQPAPRPRLRHPRPNPPCRRRQNQSSRPGRRN